MRANVARFLLVLILGSVFSTAASAQAQKLFEKVPGVDLTVVQQRALARIRAMASTANVEFVKVDADVLRKADTIDLGVERVFQSTMQTKIRHDKDQDSFTWMGAGEGSTSATFTVTKGIVGGSIFADKPYSIEPLGGGLNAFVTVDPKQFPPDHPAGEPLHRQQRTQSAGARVAAGPVFIDVLVVLAKGAAALFPGPVEQVNYVDRAIDATNHSYLNSGVAIALRRSSSSPYLVDYEETGFTTDLVRLMVSDDSFMNDVHTVRASDNADVVVLIVASANGFCGRAAATMASKDTAFAMVSAHCAPERLAFAHEIGHLQGASHDDEPGFFSFGHGYCNASGQGTVMASRLTCPNRMPQWSRPPIWGSASFEHNVRVLNQTASDVAAFLP